MGGKWGGAFPIEGEPIGILLRDVDPTELRAQIAEARAAGEPVYVRGPGHHPDELTPQQRRGITP